jgi:hypothetical protein
MSDDTSINTALMKQLLLVGRNSDQKITNEALEAASFLLREFILEARNRASVEVSIFVRQLFTYLTGDMIGEP